MIISLSPSAFDALADGIAPSGYRILPDSPIAPEEVLRMLAGLNRLVAMEFTPSAWMIVEDGDIVGLCSLIKTSENGVLHIGYGVAASREGRGIATAAVGELLDWARSDPRVSGIAAETAIENLASQRVLERNGFSNVGQRTDPEDGPVFRWEIVTV